MMRAASYLKARYGRRAKLGLSLLPRDLKVEKGLWTILTQLRSDARSEPRNAIPRQWSKIDRTLRLSSAKESNHHSALPHVCGSGSASLVWTTESSLRLSPCFENALFFFLISYKRERGTREQSRVLSSSLASNVRVFRGRNEAEGKEEKTIFYRLQSKSRNWQAGGSARVTAKHHAPASRDVRLALRQRHYSPSSNCINH